MSACTQVEVNAYPVQVEVTAIQQDIVVEDRRLVVEVLRDCNITVGGEVGYQYFAIASNGQTVFDLPYAIPSPDKSRLYLNGQKQVYGVDYVVNASVLNYSGVALVTTDYLEIYW